MKSILFVVVCIGILYNYVECQTPAQRSAIAVTALNGWYNTGKGQWDTTGWWNSANALTAVIHFSSRTNNHTYDSIISNTFSKHSSYLNDYYDDEGWWALAWIEAYKYTKNGDYLKMAETIYNDIIKGWDNDCSGGVWWDKKKSYKNAIPNELAFQLASSLYIQTKDNQYLTWANTEWSWFNKTGMINSNHLVNDGLTSACKNNGGATWTYNQGVILGGLINMYEITKTAAYLNEATAIADAALGALVNAQGVLRDPCEPNCGGGDVPQFKGIFVRNLGYLYQQTKNAKYAAFFTKNADSIWNSSARSGNHIGLFWAGPFDAADAARQSSALDALNAALLV